VFPISGDKIRKSANNYLYFNILNTHGEDSPNFWSKAGNTYYSCGLSLFCRFYAWITGEVGQLIKTRKW